MPVAPVACPYRGCDRPAKRGVLEDLLSTTLDRVVEVRNDGDCFALVDTPDVAVRGKGLRSSGKRLVMRGSLGKEAAFPGAMALC